MKHLHVFLFAVLGSISSFTILFFFSENSQSVDDDAEQGFVLYLRYDPLFALPQVDLDAFEHARTVLIEERQKIITADIDIHDDWIEQALYPTDFLKELGQLEQIRRNILNGILQTINVERYQNQLLRTIDVYLQQLRNYINIVTEYKRDNPHEKAILYGSGSNSLSYYTDLLADYENQVIAKRQEAIRRWECMHKKCNDDSIKPYAGTIAPEIDLIDDHITQSEPARLTQVLRKNTTRGKKTGPGWAVLDSHVCYTYQYQQAYYHLWNTQYDEQSQSFAADLVNDVYLVNKEKKKETGTEYYKRLFEYGAGPYAFQSLFAHYQCPDLAHDAALLTSLINVYDNVPTEINNISKNPSHVIVDQLKQITDAQIFLTTQDFLQEKDVDTVIQKIYMLLSSHNRDILIEHVGEQRVFELEETLLGYRNRTASFDQLLLQVANNNKALLDFGQYDEWDFTKELLFIRAVPKLFFGGTNQSIIADESFWIQFPRIQLQDRLVSYNNELKEIFSFEEIQQMIIDSHIAELLVSQDAGHQYIFTD